MPNKFLLLSFLFLYSLSYAQETEPVAPKIEAEEIDEAFKEYEPLKPARAAFYSAILPGLGQAYNKDYWKMPLVYGAIGTGVGIAVYNHDLFQKYRTAYKDRIAGRIDEFTIIADDGSITQTFTEDQLIRAQDFYRRNKELSILITAGIYVLQIIEANVDAHLSQYEVEDRLSFSPFMERNTFDYNNTFGMRLTYTF
ncbi:hypothetical protein DSM03_102425 [Leeuwenhoekiella aestuarii]|uniref:DUF5683 domain-containing protein n=1 Tax=Leeuwenhoekiella aestuarii TaxID=2249426 RepID=A0A4Q0NUM8_9FLAO|nr:DUF5683 domain-containing protein [Leeuwenhoekiella aestuarii]RXG15345.1 hypothetical protein DSM04_103233 [Leeuwenhoekiella aestuarii]RXG17548.1 hypothetical protein DSM03_102425 [Leeuwenhoekiella aestuarii]